MEFGTIIGEYTAMELIGSGGYGTVHRGRHVTRGTQVCLKRPHPFRPELLAPFRKEAVILWGLRHACLPTLEACYSDKNGVVTLVMPYIKGANLWKMVSKTLITKKDPFPAQEACEILLQVLDGLDHLHRRGYVHRDVKPGNVIYDRETCRATLIDLGACTDDPAAEVKPGFIEGTLGYVSPEVILGEPASPAADLYGLGMMAAGLAGIQLHISDVLNVRLEETRPIHPSFKRVIEILTREDPALRPLTASEAAGLVAQACAEMAADSSSEHT